MRTIPVYGSHDELCIGYSFGYCDAYTSGMIHELDPYPVPNSGPISATIRPPGSKSITNRALVCAALANGTSRLSGALDSEDTQVMLQCLGKLGIHTEFASDRSGISVRGCGGNIPASDADLAVGNSGTTIRFLTAVVTLGSGTYRLDGIARMRERPIGDLVDSLNQLGASVSTENAKRCPPVMVKGTGLSGGKVTIKGDISSQFLSGLMMSAPCAHAPVQIIVEGPLVSRPYVDMTRRVMESFGVPVATSNVDRFDVPSPCQYQPTDYAIEPDASAATYFWAAAAITGGSVTVDGLSHDAIQGDVGFCDCLSQMGCHVEYLPNQIRVTGGNLRGIDVDMNGISDTVQTLAAVALIADGPTSITGVAHIRHKETDRIGDLANELRKLGATVHERQDGLTIVPGPLRAATIETYHDHRMAMSMAIAGLKIPGVKIKDPLCTNKTYPAFFRDLERVID